MIDKAQFNQSHMFLHRRGCSVWETSGRDY